MKEELLELLNSLSESEFAKVKQLYAMQGLKGNTREEFVNNISSDKLTQGIINLCKKQLGK